jgi:hypothetical protein
MNGYPIHQNLSTSFVNFAALVRHLRDLQFTGCVKLELSSYEAEIIFTTKDRVQAREYDRLVGRISQGEHAFRRILVRAREPFGRIQVVRTDAVESIELIKKPFVDERIITGARVGAVELSGSSTTSRTENLGPRRREEVRNLAAELLSVFQDSFSRTGMSFEQAFDNACQFVSEEFSFLDPEKGDVKFRDGQLTFVTLPETARLFHGLTTALRHILDRLNGAPNYSKLLVYTRHRLQQHTSLKHSSYAANGLIVYVDNLLERN